MKPLNIEKKEAIQLASPERVESKKDAHPVQVHWEENRTFPIHLGLKNCFVELMKTGVSMEGNDGKQIIIKCPGNQWLSEGGF